MPTLNSNTLIKRHPDIAWRKIGDYLMAITPGNNSVHRFNETGATIWELLGEDGITFNNLCIGLENEFEVPKSTAESDLKIFLEEVSKKGIVNLE